MPNIQVNVDINKDQIQPDSGDRFQVIISTDTTPTKYTTDKGVTVKGDNLIVTVPEAPTTLGDMKAEYATVSARAALLAIRIPLVQAAVDKALDGLVNGAAVAEIK